MIIDVADNVEPHLASLKAAGVVAIIRYDDRFAGGSGKQVGWPEAKAIADAGMQLGIVYEFNGNHAGAFGREIGYFDAKYSRGRALSRGQPEGSAIYFAVDFDPSTVEMVNNVIPYFQGIAQAFAEADNLPKLRVGAYGSGYCCRILRERGLIEYTWLTCSLGFRESRQAVQAGQYDLWQSSCDKWLAGMSIDPDIYRHQAGKPDGDWGQFTPFVASPRPAPVPPPIPPGPAPFSQIGLASWYDDNSNADGSPVKPGDMTAAHRTLAFNTLCKVTRTDTGVHCVVKITDRGPFVVGRIIDLRPAPAHALGMIAAGVVPVKIEVVAS